MEVTLFHTDRYDEANNCCANSSKKIKNYVCRVKWNVVKIGNTLRDFMTVYGNWVSLIVEYEIKINAKNLIPRYGG
jgi:hypothetical protein